jgi:1-phosphofructokinase
MGIHRLLYTLTGSTANAMRTVFSRNFAMTQPEPSKAHVAVFAPTPLLTVTIETRADGQPELHVHAGGQGFWVARMVAHLGVPVTLCAPLGGDTGRLLKSLMAESEIVIQAVKITGANGSYVHDRRTGERIEICLIGGNKLNRHETDDLYGAMLSAALDAKLVALTGQYPTPVIPSTIFRRLAHDARTNGKYVLADLSKEDLAEALQGGVDLLCFSHEELIKDDFAESDQPDDLVRGLKRLRQQGAHDIILHRGAQPSLVLLGDKVVEIVTPQVMPLDAHGGGDTFFAALVSGLARGHAMQETLRFAAAAGTLNVTRRGLGTGRSEDIEAISRHVVIRPLEGEPAA